MNGEQPVPHRVSLSASADQIAPGCVVLLTWKVVGVGAAVCSVHLITAIDAGPQMIERVAFTGSRDVIFSCGGVFRFTLIATFGDGVKCVRCVSVRVAE